MLDVRAAQGEVSDDERLWRGAEPSDLDDDGRLKTAALTIQEFMDPNRKGVSVYRAKMTNADAFRREHSVILEVSARDVRDIRDPTLGYFPFDVVADVEDGDDEAHALILRRSTELERQTIRRCREELLDLFKEV